MAIARSDRREFLQTLASGALSFARPGRAAAAAGSAGKQLRGVFPIGQTPFTEDDKLDLECLAREVQFCNRGGVHGFVWPQIASGWSNLSHQERLDGAEAILAAGKGGKTALVIGCQVQGADLARSIQYAKHAAKHGADAVISLPPEKGSEKDYFEFYKMLGAATELPLIVQTVGNVSIDLLVEMYKAIPTMKVVKDEAGNPLERVTEIRQRTGDKLAVFSGQGVRTMIEEMRLGFAGHCPTTGLADIYAQAFDLWHAGKRLEAFDMFGRILAFGSIPGAQNYILTARGVFKETTRTRPTPGMGGGPGGQRQQPLTEERKRVIREALDTYLRSYLRA